MAAGATAATDPGRHLLDKIDAREQALPREAEQAQARIGELTAPSTPRPPCLPADPDRLR
jgi:hypothetical protein